MYVTLGLITEVSAEGTHDLYRH